MVKKFLFLFIFIFSFNSCVYSENKEISKGALQNVINSVVSVYTLSSNKEEEIKNFFKSTNTSGDKGSGVIIAEDGLLITNNHVIDGKSTIKIILYDGRVFKADVLVRDKELDLAILEIQSKKTKFRAIKVSDNSSTLELGDTVYAIGNPFGIGLSVTSGIISALPSKNNSFSGLGKLIQTDASMNPGNSGGALLNKKGELIGINTGIFGDVFIGIGFAIPTEVIQLFINRSISGQKIKKYWLGFSGVDVTSEMLDKLGLYSPKGVIITDVFKGSTGEKAGVKVGDVVLKLNSTEIDSTSTLSFLVASIDNPTPAELSLLRGGKVIKLLITPEEPKDNIPSNITMISKGFLKDALFANNSNAIAYEIGSDILEQGVVFYDISKNSFLYDLGLKIGDSLISINGKKVKDVDSLLKILDELKNVVDYNIVVKRDGTEISISVTYSEG